jgi:hypothetical protein
MKAKIWAESTAAERRAARSAPLALIAQISCDVGR